MPKLSDTQLVILSNAAKRDDGAIELTPKLKGMAGEAVLKSLIDRQLCAQVHRAGTLPLWKTSEQGGPVSLIITPQGLEAIGVDANDVPPHSHTAAKSKSSKPGRSQGKASVESAGTNSASTAKKPAASPKKSAPRAKDLVAPKRKSKGAPTPPATYDNRKHKAGDDGIRIRTGSKLSKVIDMLRKPGGASLQAIMKETDWQAHSVRGAISGAIKKKLGLMVTSEARGDDRFYCIGG